MKDILCSSGRFLYSSISRRRYCPSLLWSAVLILIFPLDIPAQIRPESYKTLFFPLICVIIFCFAGIIWFSVILTATYITFFALTFFRFRR